MYICRWRRPCRVSFVLWNGDLGKTEKQRSGLLCVSETSHIPHLTASEGFRLQLAMLPHAEHFYPVPNEWPHIPLGLWHGDTVEHTGDKDSEPVHSCVCPTSFISYQASTVWNPHVRNRVSTIKNRIVLPSRHPHSMVRPLNYNDNSKLGISWS